MSKNTLFGIHLNKYYSVSWGQDQAEADIVVAVRRIPVVAVGDATIVSVVDPGAAAVHAVLAYGVFT